MKYTLEYPSELPIASDELLEPDVIRQLAQQAETSGFSAVALSEHPAPSVKWRRNGGHNTLDPIAALSFMAGVTTRIKLMTNLYVLPFRNPYLSAKALGSLDLISGGRLIAVSVPAICGPNSPRWASTSTVARSCSMSPSDVQVVCPHFEIDDHASLERACDVLGELASYGATSAVVQADGSSPQAAADFIKAFGEAVIAGS